MCIQSWKEKNLLSYKHLEFSNQLPICTCAKQTIQVSEMGT